MSTALRRSFLSSALPMAAFGLMSIGVAGFGRAEEVIDPYAVRVELPPPPATTTTTTTQQTVTAPAPQAPIVYPPPQAYPPPATFGYQPPQAGQPSSTPPNYQQGYHLYPQNGGPPVYYAPPPAYPVYGVPSYPYYPAPLMHPRPPAKKWDGVRRFSLGLHGAFVALNQTFDNQRLYMGGAGFQLRLRSAGRFGFEVRQSFLKGQVWNGGFTRQSFPFTTSLMFYLFPNQDARHFNVYALAGVGAGMDFIELRNGPYGYPGNQVFLSWIAQTGLGAELRFKWFAIEADVRVAGLFRDKNFGDATYYSGVNSSAPVAAKTLAVSGNAFMSFWF